MVMLNSAATSRSCGDGSRREFSERGGPLFLAKSRSQAKRKKKEKKEKKPEQQIAGFRFQFRHEPCEASWRSRGPWTPAPSPRGTAPSATGWSRLPSAFSFSFILVILNTFKRRIKRKKTDQNVYAGYIQETKQTISESSCQNKSYPPFASVKLIRSLPDLVRRRAVVCAFPEFVAALLQANFEELAGGLEQHSGDVTAVPQTRHFCFKL